MRFTFKVFFCTIIIVAVAMGVSGTYLINSLLDKAVQRETEQSMEENDLLRFAFETIAVNVPLKYGRLQDKTVAEIAATLNTGRLIRISGEDKEPLHSLNEIEANNALLALIDDATQACRLIQIDKNYYINTATIINVAGRVLYMETFKDISSIFQDRDTGFVIYRNISVLTLIVSAVVMSFISLWLTRPIFTLSRATKLMASGNYRRRAKRISNDELGHLTDDFNSMANALELRMTELKEFALSQERFVAAFAHEMKTPLTAIIGYADLLRSRELDEESGFMSANYIYTEGKRLEKLSLRLLDIIILKNRALEAKAVPVSTIFDTVEDTFRAEQSVHMVIKYDEADIIAEANLITTALINIAENAVKASEEGGTVEILGQVSDDGYVFLVRDYGCGIAPGEIDMITQAFYTADKSRSKRRHGIGLGLALCSDILLLHGSALAITSTLGKGTEIGFAIRMKD